MINTAGCVHLQNEWDDAREPGGPTATLLQNDTAVEPEANSMMQRESVCALLRSYKLGSFRI